MCLYSCSRKAIS